MGRLLPGRQTPNALDWLFTYLCVNLQIMVHKKCLKKNIYKYTVLFESQKEGGFTVTVPTLPGCISEGDTYEEAANNIKEAIQLYLEDVPVKDREDIYAPSESFVAPVEVCLV